MRQKITKDTVSEGFSVTMVLADLIPVVFFWFSAIRAGPVSYTHLTLPTKA